MVDRLLDLLDPRLGAALDAEVVPEVTLKDDHLSRVSGRTVYITHPGPNGPVHQCQETPY
jgi:hypothetical protein